ncbi:MAG: hypothetical protein ABJC04_05830 [Verrucomicrobiota bacterium]
MSKDSIKIGGARERNLRNLTLQIPRDKLVVITGLSGSGKSSLAFDTIYAEGQQTALNSTFLRKNRGELFINHIARLGEVAKTFRTGLSRCVVENDAMFSNSNSIEAGEIALQGFNVSLSLRE